MRRKRFVRSQPVVEEDDDDDEGKKEAKLKTKRGRKDESNIVLGQVEVLNI